jgi:hypothetical protein
VKVKIIKSIKRRRTVSARVVGDILEVRVPLLLPGSEIERVTAIFLKKAQARNAIGSDEFLAKRAIFLYSRYFSKRLPNFQISWSKKQKKGFGVCYPKTKNIRISQRLSKVPLWVLDYIIIHELAHLKHSNHGSGFWQQVKKYPKTEKAQGFLQGMEFDR